MKELGVCRDCGKEAVVDPKLQLGSVCLRKYGIQPEIKKNKAAKPVKVNKRDLSKIKNTFDLHDDVEEAPFDLTVHRALTEAGYENFNYDQVEEIFDVTIQNFFNGENVPAEFKDKLNAIGFEVKGYLPRMKSSSANFINLIVGTKNSKLDMLLRFNISYEKALIYFRTNPQYTLLNADEDDLFISLRDEVPADISEGPSEFNYFMTKSGKTPHKEYLENFPMWIEENCNSTNPADKKNAFSVANLSASKFRGNIKMAMHLKQLSENEIKRSAFMSPEQPMVSPLRNNICKYVASKHDDLSDMQTLRQAVDEVDIHTYDIYTTKLGRIFSHISCKASLNDRISDVDRPVPESAENNAITRKLLNAMDICIQKGYSVSKARDLTLKLYNSYMDELDLES